MAYADIYRRDRLFLPQQKLLAFVKDVPTPFYLYHEEGIRKTARLILGSFRRCGNHRAYFPVSANNCPGILRLFREEGFGALARSVPELELARSCGFTDMLFHTAAMTQQAVKAVREAEAGVIFDAPGQIDAFSGRLPERCLLRCHPDRDLRKSYVSAYSRRGKAGMSPEQVREAARTLSRLGVQRIGLHCHLAGNVQSEDFYVLSASILLELAAALYSDGIPIDILDPGGGLGLYAGPGQPMLRMSAVGARVAKEYAQLPDGFRPALYTEFGRYAIARHGILVSRVAELRERSRSYAVLDVSTAQLGGSHGNLHISVVGNCAKSGRRVYSVHGCTPDARELLCDRAILPPLRVGTPVAVHECGAYCQSAQSSRDLLPPCPGYLYTTDGELVPL